MKIVELIALNQHRYTKILILKSNSENLNPSMRYIEEHNIYGDMSLVPSSFYDFDAKDYFLLDFEGVREVVFDGGEINIEIEEEDTVLVIMI